MGGAILACLGSCNSRSDGCIVVSRKQQDRNIPQINQSIRNHVHVLIDSRDKMCSRLIAGGRADLLPICISLAHKDRSMLN